MTRLCRYWTLFVALVAAAGCASPASAPSGSTGSLGTVSAVLIDFTNAERSRAGLPAFGVSSRLAQAAQIQADQTATFGQVEHDLPAAKYPRLEDRLSAAGYRWQTAGENLASGQPGAAEAVQGWMGSPEHRALMLSTSFTEIGAGYTTDTGGRPYFVLVFGRPAPAP